jgi:hypothetical protein
MSLSQQSGRTHSCYVIDMCNVFTEYHSSILNKIWQKLVCIKPSQKTENGIINKIVPFCVML